LATLGGTINYIISLSHSPTGKKVMDNTNKHSSSPNKTLTLPHKALIASELAGKTGFSQPNNMQTMD